MKYFIAISTLLCLLACSAEKRVQRHQQQYDAIVNEYIKNHPLQVDTAILLLQGDTVKTTTEHTDTFYIKHTDTTSVDKIIYKTTVQYNTIHDTLKITKVDNTTINILRKESVDLNQKLTAANDKSDKWFWYFIISLFVNALLSIILFKR